MNFSDLARARQCGILVVRRETKNVEVRRRRWSHCVVRADVYASVVDTLAAGIAPALQSWSTFQSAQLEDSQATPHGLRSTVAVAVGGAREVLVIVLSHWTRPV